MTQSSGANSQPKQSEIERFSTLNLKDSIIVNCQ